MIRDFKAKIFCRENNLSTREIDTGDQVWIDRIDAFFRSTSLLPPDGDPTEYANAFEAVYPQPRHRRQYIDDAIAKGTPCFGHRVLGSHPRARLHEMAGLVQQLWRGRCSGAQAHRPAGPGADEGQAVDVQARAGDVLAAEGDIP